MKTEMSKVNENFNLLNDNLTKNFKTLTSSNENMAKNFELLAKTILKFISPKSQDEKKRQN